jgi:hypothetical protein
LALQNARMPDAARAPWKALLTEVRALLAAGKPVDRNAFAARVNELAPPNEVDGALGQLDRVLAVGRARARLAEEPKPASLPPNRPLRAALKARPTLNANMDVHRRVQGESHALAWDAAPGVTEWELRIADRVDARSDYVQRETQTLPADATAVELPLTDRTLRIHLIGRGRGGKLLRRAVISGLSRENWNERWQKRASAA